MKKIFALSVAALALAALMFAPLQAHGAGADSVPPTPTPVTTPVPSYGVNQAPGVPAITPEPQMRARALAVVGTTAYSTTATYTVADVRAFLTAHPLFSTTDGSPITITAILFIPAAQASARMGGSSADRPDDTVVCYVEVTGHLVVASHHLPHDAWVHRGHVAPPVYKPQRPHALAKLPVGQLIFDAQTGNLLSRGFYY